VLILANLALAGSALVGGLSTNVATYLVAALLLGAYFALQSGTLDSIIYDVLAEETGHSDGFQKEIGRLRLWESVALVSSALAGGGLAALTSPRMTYFLTIPFVVLSIGALSRFTEPRLHRAGHALPLRSQIATTYRTIVERGRLAHHHHHGAVRAPAADAARIRAAVDGQLAAPAILYGPQWAGLMSAVGLGGVLAGRITLTRPPPWHGCRGNARVQPHADGQP
jgi:MFS family permease